MNPENLYVAECFANKGIDNEESKTESTGPRLQNRKENEPHHNRA